jgi:hypothetical protein
LVYSFLMGRGNEENPQKGTPPERRMNTSVMPPIVPEESDFRDGYKRDRHYPPRVAAGRNINIFPMIADTVTDIPEGEKIHETMRRVIDEDIKEFTGTDELYYYFRTNHEGLKIEYPDGSEETFAINDDSLTSTLKDGDGKESAHTYLHFPKDFYLDPYKGEDPVMTEKKRIKAEINEKVKEWQNSPEDKKELEEMFDFVDSKEEWDKRQAEGTLHPDGKMTVIRSDEEHAKKVFEDIGRMNKGLPPKHATPPNPGETPPWLQDNSEEKNIDEFIESIKKDGIATDEELTQAAKGLAKESGQDWSDLSEEARDALKEKAEKAMLDMLSSVMKSFGKESS